MLAAILSSSNTNINASVSETHYLHPIFSSNFLGTSGKIRQYLAGRTHEAYPGLRFGVPMIMSKKKGVGVVTNPSPEALQRPRKRTRLNDSTG